MNEIIECVPNFSTSDPSVVEAIVGAVRRVDEAYVLDYTFDDYYNRLVVTLIGNRDSVLKASLESAQQAVKLIDMNKHRGQHPRIGAVDVVPFVPIKNVTMKDCIIVARNFGRALAAKNRVPVYLYGEAAWTPERGDIDWIRKGEYEKLEDMMKQIDRKPDFGPTRPHPTAGATITGARKVMVGFNVNLETGDLEIAKKIAKALHARKGGFSFVKAMAAKIPERNITQIGMSIVDCEKTPLYRVFETIKIEAARYNVQVIGSEFCGLAPLQALLDSVGYYMKIDNLEANRILERAIQNALEKGRKQK